MIFRDRTTPNVDLNFLGTALVLAMVGCLLVYSATFFNEPNLNTFKRQMLWVGIGLALALIILMVDYHVLFDIAPILYGIGIILLIYLLVWGQVTANVKSWIRIGGFQFQPSEFMKVFTALMLARYFDSNDRAYLDFRSFMIAMVKTRSALHMRSAYSARTIAPPAKPYISPTTEKMKSVWCSGMKPNFP